MEETRFHAVPLKMFAQIFAVFLVSLCAFFAFTHQAFAATTMYLSPATGSFAPNATFTVNVDISTTTDKPANAISGTVSFPKDLLEVTSTSTAGSIVTLWVANPTYSNTAGTVHFEGVIVNPGYNGSAGKIVSITFKAKASGSASVTFPSGSILANDGLGTNILTGFGSGKYTITGSEVPSPTPTPTPTPTPVVGVPAAPVITSSTHPDQNAWVSNNNVSFAWKLPAGTTGVNILADHNPLTDPGTTSDGNFSTYDYTNVDDGVWYMHVKFRNVNGWGPTSHYKFQIDTVAPKSFDVESLDGKDVTVANPRLSFFTDDATSGVDHYVVKINGVDVAHVAAADMAQGSTYTLPTQTSGDKAVEVDAVDKAGNIMSSKVAFTVTLPATEQPAAETNTAFFGAGFPSLSALTVIAGLLLLLALLFAVFVLWRSASVWGVFLVGRRRRKLLSQLISLRTYIAKHFKELQRDIVLTGFTAAEKKTAQRVAKNLHELQESLNEEIDYLSE